MPPRRPLRVLVVALVASSIALAALLVATWLRVTQLGSTVETLQRDLTHLKTARLRDPGRPGDAVPAGLVRFELEVPGGGELFPAMSTSDAPEYWPLATLRMTNSADRPLAQTVSAQIPGWSLRADQSVVLAAGETRQIRIQPDLLPLAYENDAAQRASLDVRVTGTDASVLFAQSRALVIRGGAEIFWGRGFANAQVASRWVTPHAPAVLELVSQSRRFVRRGRMAGYNAPGGGGALEAQVRAQAAAIYRALQRSGPRRIEGSAEPLGEAGGPQRIRLPVETLRQSSATAIDVSVTFASAVENLGMQPLLTLVKGRALVGIRVGRNSDAVLYVDLSALPEGGFEDAVARARDVVDTAPRTDLLAVDVAAARALGLYPLAERTAGAVAVARTASVEG